MPKIPFLIKTFKTQIALEHFSAVPWGHKGQKIQLTEIFSSLHLDKFEEIFQDPIWPFFLEHIFQSEEFKK